MIPFVERFFPVGDNLVRHFENLFGHTLPADYFNFLSSVNGWWIAVAASVSVPGVDRPVNISEFYVVAGQWERQVDEEYVVPDIMQVRKEIFRSSIPTDFLVIASGPEGQFVMDFRNEAYGEIYFHDTFRHKININPFLTDDFFEKQGLSKEEKFSYVKISDSFSNFIEKIYIEKSG